MQYNNVKKLKWHKYKNHKKHNQKKNADGI